MSSNPVSNGSAVFNKLLASLPETDWQRLEPHLSLFEVSAGKTLCEPSASLDHAYFPTTSILSELHVAPDGAATEVATVGNEGMMGISLCLGARCTPNRIIVQSKGEMYRLKGSALRQEFGRGGALQLLMLRYMHALLTQISQTAVCNRRHSIEQQLCLWLLQSADRLCSDELTMTHELLANTLGVRREGITEAAHKLQSVGLITYRRGRIKIIDRDGVAASCCECYGIVRREYDRLPGAHLDPVRMLSEPADSTKNASQPLRASADARQRIILELIEHP